MKNKIPEELYKEILENMPICCVDAVVVYNNKVLMIYRNIEPCKNQWCFPGGRIYKNEKMKEAVTRKVLEETGLEVKIIKKIGVYETMFNRGPFDDLKTGVHTTNIPFLVKPLYKDFKIKLDKTSSDYKWINKIDKDFHPYIKKVLKDSKILD